MFGFVRAVVSCFSVKVLGTGTERHFLCAFGSHALFSRRPPLPEVALPGLEGGVGMHLASFLLSAILNLNFSVIVFIPAKTLKVAETLRGLG